MDRQIKTLRNKLSLINKNHDKFNEEKVCQITSDKIHF